MVQDWCELRSCVTFGTVKSGSNTSSGSTFYTTQCEILASACSKPMSSSSFEQEAKASYGSAKHSHLREHLEAWLNTYTVVVLVIFATRAPKAERK